MRQKLFLENKLSEIDQVISSLWIQKQNIGVLSGVSGISLFKLYYGKYLDNYNSRKLDDAVELLTEAINRVNKGYNLPTYCSGIAGLGWVIDHIKQENFVEIESDALLSDLDDFIYKSLIVAMNNGNYDFLHGGLGYAYYFLNRYQNTDSLKLRRKYKKILIEFVDLLKKMSEKIDDGIRWKSILDRDSQTEGYNFGLSHGIPSITMFLAKLYNIFDFKNDIENLLLGSINYLLKNKNCESISLFPNSINLDGKSNVPSRLAWCYGDLGVGNTLWNIAKLINSEELKDTALCILIHSTYRNTKEKNRVIDAGFCHGSFGIAHIYQKLYNETKEIRFKKAAQFWLNNGLEKSNFSDGYAGFKKYSEGNEWSKELSLLEGIAGIGLVMIGFIANFEPKWDECLMIS